MHTAAITTTNHRQPSRDDARSVLREGVAAGALAASGVAALFFVGDVLVGNPFVTPRMLGSLLGGVLGLPALSASPVAAVLAYTAAHYLAFAALGVAAAAVTRLAWRHATALAAALLVLAVVEVTFAGALALFDQVTVTGGFTWRQLAMGNVLGLTIIGGWLARRHPEIGAELRVALTEGV